MRNIKKMVLTHIREVLEYDGFGRHKFPNI